VLTLHELAHKGKLKDINKIFGSSPSPELLINTGDHESQNIFHFVASQGNIKLFMSANLVDPNWQLVLGV
jgi:hypothetical protein